jgi:hypothetical protein
MDLRLQSDDHPVRGQAKIARRLRRERTMALDWIADRLHMGSASYVSHFLAKK